VCLILAVNTGCYTEVVWLPDSSGFIYTTPEGRLVRYDVTTEKRQVLVADTGTKTTLPALNPEGKRVAVARLLGQSKVRDAGVEVGLDTLEVIVYDLDGKELQHSPQAVWRKDGLYGRKGGHISNPDGYTVLLWGPKGNEDKLAIFEPFIGDSKWGLYDLKTERLEVVRPGRPFSPSPAAGAGGFLVYDDIHPTSIAFVDWEGKEHPITMKRLDKKDLEKASLSDTPWEQWEGKTFVGKLPPYLVRIDTEKRVGVFEQNPGDNVPAEKESVAKEYAFPEGGARARIISFGEKDSGVIKTYYRLEVIKPGDKKSQVILDKRGNNVSLIPAPNKKLLAIRIATVSDDRKTDVSDKILLLNSEGKVVKEIIEADK
jgi:hypothetical protein